MAALIGGGASLLGGLLGRESSRSSANRNIDLQREFAQQGIRWRVEDAKAAGIHPLYALGASPASFSPISVSDPLGPAIASAGQDVSRAYEATRTRSERNTLDQLRAQERMALMQLDRERRANDREDARLSSQLLNDEVQRQYWLSQIRRNEQQRGVAMPESVAAPAGGSVGAVKVKPHEVVSRGVGTPHKAAGSAPFWVTTEVAPGQYVDVPNPDVMQDPGELAMGAVTASSYVKKWLYEHGLSEQHWRGARSELERKAYDQRANWGWPGYSRRRGR